MLIVVGKVGTYTTIMPNLSFPTTVITVFFLVLTFLIYYPYIIAYLKGFHLATLNLKSGVRAQGDNSHNTVS